MTNQRWFRKAERTTGKAFVSVFSMALCLLCADVREGHAGAISQVPLFTAVGGIEPNVLFMLDDSGSMMFEIMPDEYSYWNMEHGSVAYVFPPANGVYGSTDYTKKVATIEDNVAYSAAMRSSAINPLYYDPAVTYQPWTRYDGSSYPDADIDCALHNPERSGTGFDFCRDLTVDLQNSASPGDTYWSNCNSASCTSDDTALPNASFKTATYFTYDGGDQWNFNSYTKREIVPATTSYSGEGRAARTDCSAGSCTYAQEIQNFANWYTYHRSRILAARAGIGKAFVNLSNKIRVGFGAINQDSTSIDGVDTKAIINGVRPFTMANRQTFFDNLYGHPIPAEGTPLRMALDAAGQYFSRTDNRGPWCDTPGTESSSTSTCRQSYTILMTDGYWTGGTDYDADTADARDNNDGTDGPTVTGPGSQTSTYAAESPFEDDQSSTLADVAMYYWKRDLHSSLDNEVPASVQNPAFWQHMVTFGVGLGVAGTIAKDDAFDAIGSTTTTITWSDPNTGLDTCSGATCGARIDDLLHASVNSRGDFFSAQNPDAFASELSSILQNIVARSASSAASLAANSTRIDTDTLIYQAQFDSSDWSGRILAYSLASDGSITDPDHDGNIEEDAVWDTDTAGKIPAHSARNLYGRIGTENVNLSWSLLTAAQQTTLTADGIDEDILDWVRGDQSNEKPSGTLRERTRLLGDIVNSNPAFVGSLNFGYDYLPTGTDGQDTYLTYRSDTQTRRKMLYAGANDGMLHAFDARTGIERFAFVPNSALAGLATLSDPNYLHRYFVDGSPQAGDAYLGAWKTILVGTSGAGGRSVFALDITHPDAFDQTQVKWEFTDADLGYPVNQLVQPVIGRMQNGEWAVVFGNGYESDNRRAFLYVVRLSDGALIKKIDTGVGDSATPNGLAGPVLLADDHRTIKYAYAGDRLGNLWKFDLSGAATADWKVAFMSGSTPMPLFQARYVSGTTETVQPISSAPEIAVHPEGGYMIYFGSGRFFETGDDTSTAVQSLYGIWDKDDGSTASYVAATDRSTLQTQTITDELTISGNKWRIVSNNAIAWSGAGAKQGWYLDLISPVTGSKGERVVSPPLIRHGRAIFTTLLPSTKICESGGTSWLLELDMVSGARLDYSVLDVNDDGSFSADDFATLAGGSRVPVSGTQSTVGVINTPSVIECGDHECKYSGGSTGGIAKIREKGAASKGRQSWRQLR